MLKTRIRTILVVVTLLFTGTLSMFAQTTQTPAAQGPGTQSNTVSNQDIEMLRKDLRAQRKEITAQNVNLTADEATKFWPIFDQYRQEAIKPNDERWALIKDYAANYNAMTDAQAQDYIKRSTDVEQQLIALRMKYVPVFEKVISPKKTALWYQVDRRIDLLINLQLSTQIPMVDTSRESGSGQVSAHGLCEEPLLRPVALHREVFRFSSGMEFRTLGRQILLN